MMEKKEECAETVQKKNFTDAYVAASADIIGDVSMAEGSSVWYQSVVRGDHDRIEIGEGSNIQDGCVLHADPGFPVMIGSYVTVGHKAIIHGCEIGDGALIGMGAIVLNGAKVGKKCNGWSRCTGNAGNGDSGWDAGTWFSGKSKTGSDRGRNGRKSKECVGIYCLCQRAVWTGFLKLRSFGKCFP